MPSIIGLQLSRPSIRNRPAVLEVCCNLSEIECKIAEDDDIGSRSPRALLAPPRPVEPITWDRLLLDAMQQTQCNRCNATGVLQPVLQYLGLWLTLCCIESDHALFLRSIALFYTELHCFALNCTGGRTKLMHLLMRLGQPLGRCSSSSTWAALRQVQSNYRRVTGNQCSWEVSEPVGSKLTSSLALRWPHLCWKAAIGFATELSELCLVMCSV